MNIYDRDKIRYNILVELYNQTDGDVRKIIDFKELGRKLNIENDEIEKAYYYLINEEFVAPRGTGYTVCLTHHGTKLVESFLRKIDFEENKDFNSTELYQLKAILQEMKEQLEILQLGQEIVFDKIDEVFLESKVKTKNEWKIYFENQIKDWSSQKIIDVSAQLILKGLLHGIKLFVEQ